MRPAQHAPDAKPAAILPRREAPLLPAIRHDEALSFTRTEIVILSGAEALRSAVEACPEPVEWEPLTVGGGEGGGPWARAGTAGVWGLAGGVGGGKGGA
jgi:hypothetical protein